MKRSRFFSNLLLSLGMALLAYSVAGYARTSAAQTELRRAWEERPVLPASLPASTALASGALTDSTPPFREGDAVARLRIGKVGLDAVVLQGISDKTLAIAPGHYPGMPYPGEGGHSVVAAHRDSFFKDFGRLQLGDGISVTRWDGREVVYGVSRIYIVHKTDRTVIVPKREERLTLITCYPFKYVGPAPYRYIVEAAPLESTQRVGAPRQGVASPS